MNKHTTKTDKIRKINRYTYLQFDALPFSNSDRQNIDKLYPQPPPNRTRLMTTGCAHHFLLYLLEQYPNNIFLIQF